MIETIMFGLVLIALSVVIIWVFLNGNLGPGEHNSGMLAMRHYGEAASAANTAPDQGAAHVAKARPKLHGAPPARSVVPPARSQPPGPQPADRSIRPASSRLRDRSARGPK
ncbi:MAG: hypothetical protein SFV21_06705 [Rhodospirillaceae bacterium]|nr:hypothetical protein [Rhodospirillaceae bacterium]